MIRLPWFLRAFDKLTNWLITRHERKIFRARTISKRNRSVGLFFNPNISNCSGSPPPEQSARLAGDDALRNVASLTGREGVRMRASSLISRRTGEFVRVLLETGRGYGSGLFG